MEDDIDQHVLWVPVREIPGGAVTVRTGRSPGAERVGIGFSSEAGLRLALGAGHGSVRLAGGALRALLLPLGVTRFEVDPVVLDPALLRLGERLVGSAA
ncbi:SAV_915 family protein [Actinocorallia populi]|uniref:SAV_915 family protein n=1 Tax=Actinocorallia populi TaxID=2079200 RepID=UPI000D087DEB|nr:SAV_915 family protein [Actinocorallia populi]